MTKLCQRVCDYALGRDQWILYDKEMWPGYAKIVIVNAKGTFQILELSFLISGYFFKNVLTFQNLKVGTYIYVQSNLNN